MKTLKTENFVDVEIKKHLPLGFLFFSSSPLLHKLHDLLQ